MGNGAKKFSGMRIIKNSTSSTNNLELTSQEELQDSTDHTRHLSKLSMITLERKSRKNQKEDADLFLKKNVRKIVFQNAPRKMKKKAPK